MYLLNEDVIVDALPHQKYLPFFMNKRLMHISSTSDPLQPDGCKLSALSTFNISNAPIWRLGNLASMEASIDHTALSI